MSVDWIIGYYVFIYTAKIYYTRVYLFSFFYSFIVCFLKLWWFDKKKKIIHTIPTKKWLRQ